MAQVTAVKKKIANGKLEIENKKKEKSKEKPAKFPIQAFINGYGFLRLSKSLLDSWGWKPGKGNRTAVTLDMQDDVLIVKKKSA